MPSDPPPPPPPAPPAAGTARTTPVQPPTRLHPFSLVRGIRTRAVLQSLPAVAILMAQFGSQLGAGGLVVIGLGLAMVRVLAWQRHTYELTGDAVVERRGILNRRERTVQLERLQQVEVEQGIADRLLGTAVLRLETASDADEAELELRVVAVADARRLRASLLPHAADAAGAGPAAHELVHVPLRHVALAAVTGPRLLAIPVVLGGLFGVLTDLDVVSDDPVHVLEGLAPLAAASLALLAVGIVAVSTVVALALGVLRDGDFRIRLVGDDLHVRRGLLATREAVVPRARVQLVSIERSWLRRLLGFGALTIHSAGGVGDSGGLERRLTVPLLPEDGLAPLATRLLPRGEPVPALSPHPPAARRRAILRAVLGSLWLVPLGASLGSLAPAVGSGARGAMFGAAAGLVLAAALGLWLGSLGHRHRAYGLGERLVVARSGAVNLHDRLAPRAKAQGTRLVSTPFQRRRGLVTLQVHVAGPGRAVGMRDLGTDTARALRDELDRRWAPPPPVPAAPLRGGTGGPSPPCP